ncbi:uncharacterized, partial [Tachysurus ichikawai]
MDTENEVLLGKKENSAALHQFPVASCDADDAILRNDPTEEHFQSK